MKKLLTLALALILAMGALGLVACGGDEKTSYTVNSEQWDNAVSLYWKNLTYEFTDGESGNKVELLEDGSLHQYEGAWGEKYCIYRTAQQVWQVYHKGNEWNEDSKTHAMDYSTEQGYIDGNYGDDFGFMGHMLPTISGRINEFTFDSANNQYVAENIGIPMTPEDVYPMNVIAKFENQKLVYVKFAAVEGSNYFEANFWDYGTTVIEFPDWMLNA